MKKKIKTLLIHRLGGFTPEEQAEWGEIRAQAGMDAAYEITKAKAEELYGLPADKWCEKMYKFIVSRTSR